MSLLVLRRGRGGPSSLKADKGDLPTVSMKGRGKPNSLKADKEDLPIISKKGRGRPSGPKVKKQDSITTSKRGRRKRSSLKDDKLSGISTDEVYTAVQSLSKEGPGGPKMDAHETYEKELLNFSRKAKKSRTFSYEEEYITSSSDSELDEAAKSDASDDWHYRPYGLVKPRKQHHIDKKRKGMEGEENWRPYVKTSKKQTRKQKSDIRIKRGPHKMTVNTDISSDAGSDNGNGVVGE